MRAITVENLGKYYPRYHQKASSLRDWLTQKTWQNNSKEIFWALKDVSFTLEAGSKLGIIGKNGAGKSTLLKILSQITEPSLGRVEIRGRVHSLLEVGTGFHPDLSGRENVFLNGMLLGMKRQEINTKFDEIVDFSGVSEFIDTPVKHYSSGMYLRLAFAVAAHLESEILLVDEVLAVGDYEFQKKCLGKMNEVAQEGKTVVFVSHNLQAVSNLTTETILIESGQVISLDNTDTVISQYLEGIKYNSLSYKQSSDTPSPYIQSVTLQTSYGNNTQETGENFQVDIEINTKEAINGVRIGVLIQDKFNKGITYLLSDDPSNAFKINLEEGIHKIRCSIPTIRLYKGQYHITIYFSEYFGGRSFEVLENICPFEIVIYKKQDRNKWLSNLSYYFEDCDWSIKKIKSGRKHYHFSYSHQKGFYKK